TKPAPPVIRMRMCCLSLAMRFESVLESTYAPPGLRALGGRIGSTSCLCDEPPEALVQRPAAGDSDERLLDGRAATLLGPVLAPVLRLLLGDRRVVGAAGVVHAQVGQHRAREADLLDLLDVGRVLEPEDLFLALLESADALVELARGDRTAAARRPAQEVDAVLDGRRVLMRAHVVADVRGLVVRV